MLPKKGLWPDCDGERHLFSSAPNRMTINSVPVNWKEAVRKVVIQPVHTSLRRLSTNYSTLLTDHNAFPIE